MSSELQPSKLGTKEHWDKVYEEEVANFEEIGDEGEIWFGEESVEKMVDWALENVPIDTNPFTLEIGCGNGTLLFALLEAGYSPQTLAGIDYSPGAIKLAKGIAATRKGEDITFSVCNLLGEIPPLLDAAVQDGFWDLILDKGTFDAIALGQKDEHGESPAAGYPARIAALLKPGGFFLITSCNFTEEELKAHFCAIPSLKYHSRIQHATYTFGGRSGSVCSSVAFQSS
ncbi:S-adenosyl-L-methionine-dependent methyltransferase [Mycena floridula]|nr:S-adenosyl-L-methionine-dependent methyltransferase [Mycena floridula]